jgi:hypothetical protein
MELAHTELDLRERRAIEDMLHAKVPVNEIAAAIRRCGLWRSLEAVEFATLEWIDWFNTRRLLEPIEHASRRSGTALSCLEKERRCGAVT